MIVSKLNQLNQLKELNKIVSKLFLRFQYKFAPFTVFAGMNTKIAIHKARDWNEVIEWMECYRLSTVCWVESRNGNTIAVRKQSNGIVRATGNNELIVA